MAVALAGIEKGALPRGNIRGAAAAFDPAQFTTVPNVPVFAEHQTKARDGRQLVFGADELRQVCERCNRRIRETGDYAAVVIGHTSDPTDPVQKEPELIGFAGPFRLGIIGEDGQRQRYAILADFHVFKADLPKFLKHPRRSPELWLEDSYEEMFLDPIALLGAEAPRLDMGLTTLGVSAKGTDGAMAYMYSAEVQGRKRERYAAAGPACSNVFVATDDNAKRYAAEAASPDTQTPTEGTATMLSPEDIRQIVDAIEELDWVQGVKGLLATNAGNNAAMPPAPEGGAPGMPPAGPAGPAGLDANAPPPMPPAMPPAPHAEPDGDEIPAGPPAGPSAPEAGPPPAPDASPPKAPDADEGNEKYGNRPAPVVPYRSLDEIGKAYAEHNQLKDAAAKNAPKPPPPKQYAAGTEIPAGGMTVETGSSASKHPDDMDDDEFEKYVNCSRSKRYGAAQGEADGDHRTNPKPSEGDVDGDGPAPGKNDGSVSGVTQGASRYEKPRGELERYARLEGEVQKLRGELAEERNRLNAERATRTDAERFSKLAYWRQFRTFDLDKEVERCKYGKMSDEQFADHVTTIEENYLSIPFGAAFPVPDEPGAQAPIEPRKPERYTRDVVDRVVGFITEKAQQGQHVNYAEALEKAAAGQPLE